MVPLRPIVQAAAMSLAGCVTAWSAVARAHHDTSPGPSAEAIDGMPLEVGSEARFRLGLTTSYAGTSERDYASLTSRVDVSPIPRLRTALLVPVHHVRRDGENSETGVGDVDLQVVGRLWEERSFRLYAGTALRMPTGDQTLDLGGGVFRLSPHVAGEAVSEMWRARLTLGDSFALSQADDAHGDFEPQSSHEIFYELTGGVSPGPAFLGATLGGATVLAADGRGDTPLWMGPKVAWLSGKRASLSLTLLVPLTEPRRFDVRVALGAQLAFY